MSTGRRSVELAPIIVFLLLRILLLPSLLVVNPSAPGASAFQVAKTNCKDNCGDVTIPYPFGIGTSCFLDEWYEVVCLQQENNTSVPRLKKIGLDVLNISLPNSYGYGSWIRVNYPIYYSSSNCTNDAGVGRPIAPPSLSGSNFVFAQGQNKFTAVGCNDVAFLESPSSAPIGCKINCSEGSNVSQFNDCSGSGCCQFAVPSDVQAFNISFQRLESATASGDGCSYAFVVDTDWLKPGSTDLYSMRNAEQVPVSLGWGISSDTSSWGNSTLAGNNHVCRINSYGFTIMQCYCADGFTGNSYLGADGHGCQDINECEDPTLNRCPGKCENMKGSYKCVDGSRAVKLAMMVIGGFVGALLFLFSARWLHRTIKRRKKMKLKQKFFKQNGGLLLRQQLASPEGNVEKSKLFNSKELDKATDNFNENRILGQGGQGTVYKGMLIDGRIVAIKKSKMLHQGDAKQFINEVSILSQINHRNVVKLFGCCLETEVPLLVYEFIPNGTLYQYLHEPNEEFPVPWDVRLRIACEVAGALSYLHSAAAMPIYHRDIKTTNILLDEKYRAKIADFGTSRSVALDQTHVTTLVQGTFGYLDPEYFQSSRFTDKSDVYSFGVVLVELLTGQKPISSLRVKEGIGLAAYFILSMEDDHLFEILDAQVSNQGNKEEINVVAHLARRCLNVKGRMRPTMKEVAVELESLRRSSHPSHVQGIEERHGNIETHAIEAEALTFRSAGFETSDGTSSARDFYPLLSGNTW